MLNINKDILIVLSIVIAVIILGILLYMEICRDINNTRKEHQKSIAAGRKRKQDELSAKMYHLRDRYASQGYVPVWIKQDFEKLYTEYQKFGSTPEIEDLRDELYSLPDHL